MDGRTDNVKTVYPLQTKFAGGINIQNNKCVAFLGFELTSRPLDQSTFQSRFYLFSSTFLAFVKTV